MIKYSFPFTPQKPLASLAHITKRHYIPAILAEPITKIVIHAVRKSMGGMSKDITTSKIIQKKYLINCDASALDIYCYRKETNAVIPAIVFFHGGGWIGGTVNAVAHFCMALAEKTNTAVFSVDYRLAPEHPYPAALDDAYLATQWLFSHAAELAIDHDQIHIAGDSAGGNLATVVCMLAKQRGDFALKSQMLLYPVVDVRHNRNDAIDLATRLYLNGQKIRDDWRVSPIVSDNLADLPRTLIAVGDIDSLYQSNHDYAKALDQHGVDVTLIVFENTHHAFIDDTGTNQQGQFLVERIAEWFIYETNS